MDGGFEDFKEILQGWSPEEIRWFHSKALEELRAREKSGSHVSDHEKGTPKDPFVQQFAAERLVELKKQMGLSYRDIAEPRGVSAERVRQVFVKLCPSDGGR